MLRTLLMVLVLALVALTGCAGPVATEAPDRGPLGKADSYGSCAAAAGDFCGGKSAGNCWCDDLCEEYGDCCDDRARVCGCGPGGCSERVVEVILTEPFCDRCSAQEKAALSARSPVVARVVDLLDQAAQSVDIAQFTFSDRTIEAAVLRAHQRGVAVRLAINVAQDRDGSVARRLRDAGVAVRFIEGRPPEGGGFTGLMHAKFMLVDGSTLLTGSNNWSSTGVSINEENTIVVRGWPEEAQIAGFACHFAVIWESRLDAAAGCSSQDVTFTPGPAARDLLRDGVRSAQHSVDVLMHHLTFDQLVRDLAEAAERGVRVRVVLNEDTRDDHRGSNWNRLAAAGGQLRYKRNNEAEFQLMHHKLAIIDDRALLNGSGNWSGSGLFNNYENYVRYREPAVVDRFRELYARLWIWSLSGDALDAGLTAAEQHAAETRVYFGNLHAHFDAVDDGGKLLDDGVAERLEDGELVAVEAGGTVAEAALLAFEYARDRGGLDFVALTPHCTDDRDTDAANHANMSAAGFQELRTAAGYVTDHSGGDFLALAGMEWSTNSTGNHVNVIGVTEVVKVERGRFDLLYGEYLPERRAAGERPLVMLNHPRTFPTNDSLEGAWDQIYGVNLTEIRNNSQRNHKFNDYGLDDYAPLKLVRDRWIAGEVLPDPAVVDATLHNIWQAGGAYLRLMEVTFNRGAEFAHEDGQNPSLIEVEDGVFERRTKVHTDWDYYLSRGFKIAPAASHDNHFANWGSGHSSRTAVIAGELTERALLDAIEQRAVYASEDQNLEIRWYAGDRVPMGGATATVGDRIDTALRLADPDYAGPYEVRLFRGRVGGDGVELVAVSHPSEARWVSIPLPLPAPGEYFFYLQVLETEADRAAWTAPIWVERL